MAPARSGSRRARSIVAGLLLCLWFSGAAAAPASTTTPSRMPLSQVDAIRTTDHARFLTMLDALHRDIDALSPQDRRYLRFLDGWQANYEGRYSDAMAALQEVLAGGQQDALGVRATAMLMNTLTGQGKYAEAYAMATRAADTLPSVTDPTARFVLLANLSQMLTFAGQPQIAMTYADMMLKATPKGVSRCEAMVQKVVALEGARQLMASSPELLDTIDVCKTNGQPIFSNTMSLILVDRLLEENRLDEALATLRRITPSIEAARYFPHLIDLSSARARIFEAMGNKPEARKAALETVAMNHPGDTNEALRFAYRVLYSIEKAQGHYADALLYYENYVVQDQGYLRDANVRTAAYEAASQHFRAEKLETEGLSKENRILRLQQALDAKAVETGRLYITVMAILLASIAFWMVRIKRSQLRFKWLSSCDSLTGIFNHQHFMGESGRALRALEKRAGEGCLIFLDLDHFKQVNDSHGHAVGDAVLKHAVAICKGQLRKADLLGRLGGEEFGMFLMDAPRLQGTVVAERIRLSLAASPLIVDDVVVSISASIGLACTDTIGYDLQRLFRGSDAALYLAKRTGRNRVVVDGDDRSAATPFPAHTRPVDSTTA
ncbi:diguanylate cyclase [Luteibacter sp. PPL552]